MTKNSILLSVCDLPKDKIEGLGLSYRDIGIRCNNIIKKYSLKDIKNDKDLIKNQQKIRRELSNWVNDPVNLVNSQGEYIGDKFGARITICLADGTVIQDVQTFCRDVKNKNNRILGKNNNYVFLKSEPVLIDPSDKKRFLYSTFNVDGLDNSVKYENVYAYKVKSSSLPSSNPNSNSIQYSSNDTSDEIDNIVSGELLDLHTTRKEYIQATTRRYGYNSRATESIVTTDHHVCKYVENIQGANDIYCRLTYFDFPAPTIIDVAVADGRFKTLFSAVKAAGLVEALSGPGPFTVFAPTDEAFKSFTPGALEALLADVHQLTKLLQYHVVAGKVMAADVVKLTFAKTLDGGLNVSIRVENGKVFVNDSQVIITDIPCANGVIHVIDAVLSPQTTTYDLLIKSNKFNTLVAALGAANLGGALSGSDPITVFAPTDAAFAALSEGSLTALLADVPQLQGLLTYHALAGKVMAADIINAIADDSVITYMTTLAGQSISVSMKNGDVIINNSAKVTITDVLGSNGVVVHVIDTVLSFQTVYQLLKADQKFDTLVTAIDAAFPEALSDPNGNPLTLFAPGNGAFGKVPAEILADLLKPENLAQLQELVGNHVYTGDIQLADDSYLDMLSRLTAYIDKNQDKLLVNGATIDAENKIVGLNGVIYPVEEILVPQSVGDMTKHIDPLNEFYKLLRGLPDNNEVKVALDDGENVTLFAPVNGAVTDLLDGITEPSEELVENVVKAHIVASEDDESLEKADLDALASANNSDPKVKNLAGGELAFTKTAAGVLKVNGTKFKKHDIKCKNGTIHTVEKVLA
jgi:transforming growth factor-beta-induced protein